LSVGDFIRGFFSRKRNPGLQELQEFIAQRKGVEGYIEPRTATQSTSLLLVDRDGASARAPVRDREDAVAFCERWSLPVYDAGVVCESRAPRRRTTDSRSAELRRRRHLHLAVTSMGEVSATRRGALPGCAPAVAALVLPRIQERLTPFILGGWSIWITRPLRR
jgi:hypothetical protein